MKKVLVAVQGYPNLEGTVSSMFVHVRNKYYIQHDIDVTVLNFDTNKDYIKDNIPVISFNTFKKNSNIKYDILICHAANIRNHYRLLKKYGKKFERFIFFFHGHEVLKINEVYPKPYDYIKKKKYFRTKFQDLYDCFKLRIWHNYYPKVAYKSDFIFVSNCFFEEFKRYTKLTKEDLCNHVHIIHNSVGSVFEENSYQLDCEKKYDFITLRSNLDGSKYCVDLVNKLALKYPQYKFLVIGRGKFYKIHNIPNNVTYIDNVLSHEEILHYVDESRYGLLLTREDTQGLLTCEFATLGIPVITSDIEVCKEVCKEVNNIILVPNNLEKIDLQKILDNNILSINKKTDKFSYNNTVRLEEELILGHSVARLIQTVKSSEKIIIQNSQLKEALGGETL